jgi:hypothetical protein
MEPITPAKREFVDRKTWELAAPALWVRLAVDTRGFIELRVQTAQGQDLLTLDTSEGKAMVHLYEPHLRGHPPLGNGRRR